MKPEGFQGFESLPLRQPSLAFGELRLGQPEGLATAFIEQCGREGCLAEAREACGGGPVNFFHACSSVTTQKSPMRDSHIRDSDRNPGSSDRPDFCDRPSHESRQSPLCLRAAKRARSRAALCRTHHRCSQKTAWHNAGQNIHTARNRHGAPSVEYRMRRSEGAGTMPHRVLELRRGAHRVVRPCRLPVSSRLRRRWLEEARYQ